MLLKHLDTQNLTRLDSRLRGNPMELGRGRGISNLDKKARITRPAPLI